MYVVLIGSIEFFHSNHQLQKDLASSLAGQLIGFKAFKFACRPPMSSDFWEPRGASYLLSTHFVEGPSVLLVRSCFMLRDGRTDRGL